MKPFPQVLLLSNVAAANPENDLDLDCFHLISPSLSIDGISDSPELSAQLLIVDCGFLTLA